MSSEIRSLRAVALIGNEILQHGHVPVWNASCEFVEPTDEFIWKMRDFTSRQYAHMKGLVKLSFYHSTAEEKQFFIYIPVIGKDDSEVNAFVNDFAEFVECLYNEMPADCRNVEIWNSDLSFASDTDISYHNSVLSFEFYEASNRHTHDTAYCDECLYTIPIAVENVLQIFNDMIDYLSC